MNADHDQAQRNAATIRKMYEAERARDLDAWVKLFNPQARATFPFSDGSYDVIGLDAMGASTAHKFATRGPMTINDEVFAMADPRWVFAIVNVSLEHAPGKTFDLLLWNRFEFDDEGRILQHQEVLDTARAARMAAPSADDADQSTTA